MSPVKTETPELHQTDSHKILVLTSYLLITSNVVKQPRQNQRPFGLGKIPTEPAS